MAILVWRDDLRVGVASVDEQHRRLVEMVNDLHGAMLSGQGKLALGQTIAGLIDYTSYHFTTEETLFAAHGYPGAAEHERQHRDFVRQVADFKQGFDEDRLMLSLDVMDFLSNWLVEHIQGSDKQFAPFLNERGVA